MRRYLIYAGLAVCALALLYARFEIFKYYEARDSLFMYGERAAVARGVVSGDPDKRSTSLRTILNVSAINGQDERGRLLIELPRESLVFHGDTIEVRGLIEAPESFETDSGRVFDYPGYLRVRGVSMVMTRATLREVEPAGLTVLGPLYSLKHRFEDSLEQVVSEPEVSLLNGMLLGERGGFTPELLKAFVIVGLIHIVVLSGSNIAIVAEGIFRLLGAVPRLPRKYLFSIGFAAIVLFALMAGGGAATLRAVVMGSIAILARYLRRPRAALRALVVAAVAMIYWNPLVLWLDTGFMLSVLATFGLITLAPSIEARLTRLPAGEMFNVRSIVATTIGVELFILPALLFSTGVLSVVSLPMNALVLPLVPVVMFVGFIAGLLGLVHPILALMPALVAQFLLALIIKVTELAAALPFASLLVAPFPWWVAVLTYVPLTLLALRIYFRSQTSLSS